MQLINNKWVQIGLVILISFALRESEVVFLLCVAMLIPQVRRKLRLDELTRVFGTPHPAAMSHANPPAKNENTSNPSASVRKRPLGLGLTDITNKTNLKTLEGPEEIFVDLLEDIGVLDLEKGGAVSFGTYENIFTNSAVAESADGEFRNILMEIDARFYENSERITLVIHKTIDSDDEQLDQAVYWFDESGNDVPSRNSNWNDILENMDIFLDEL